MDIRELVRQVRAGESERTIAVRLGVNRRTVAKYRGWAWSYGLLEGPLPSAAAIERLAEQTFDEKLPPQQLSTVNAYREEIAAYRAQGVEVAAIRARLEERHRIPISYSAVWRLVRKLEPPRVTPVVRVEVPPGSEAQVDFGAGGRVVDPVTGEVRASWVFVLVLSHSRHLYAELVWDQTVATWLRCHQHAFEAFGGVPGRIVPDNLKAAIVRASFSEPQAQRAYRECAEHYGFLIDPQPPRQPHLKGKVEQGGVHYVKRNFLAGRELEPLDERNRALRQWARETAGQRVHGTTKQRPLEVFRAVEQPALLPLPRVPFEPVVWRELTVHRDCHVTLEQAYYSVPFRLVGQRVWAQVSPRTVSVYDAGHELVATHSRASAPGTRVTELAHLPPEKVANLVLTRADCQHQADAIGPATGALVQTLLAHRPEDRLRTAGRLVRLAQTSGAARLEAACERATTFGEADYSTVKRILQGGHETHPVSDPLVPVGERAYTFVRQASELVASLVGARR